MNVKGSRRTFRKRTSKRTSRHPSGTKSFHKHRFGNPRSLAFKNNFARSVESVKYEALPANQPTTGLIVLSDFLRSSNISQNYQWYRCTEVKYTYQPSYDTYQEVESGTANPTVPQFYWVMDRAGRFTSATSFTLAQLTAMGAKPRKFTKNIDIRYKPNTLVQTGIAGTDGTPVATDTEEKFNAWFPCVNIGANHSESPSHTIPYYGHIVWIDQDNSGVEAQVCELTITATFEFKEPVFQSLPQEEQKTAIKVTSLPIKA